MTTRSNDKAKAESAYSRGSIKIKIGRMKREGIIKPGICLFCEKYMLIQSKFKMFTVNGSNHKCKGLKEYLSKV